MSEIYYLLLLTAAGIIAGFINVMAGGGSTITLPILIFMGLSPAAANGTNRVAIFLQNASAVYSFKKEQYEDFTTSIKMALFALPGSIAGAVLAVNISGELFQKILGIVLIGIIISMFIPQAKVNDKDKKSSVMIYISMIFIGFYGGFIQVGVGFILMAALKYLMKLDLVFVNMHKVFIVFIYTIPALSIFIYTNNVNWKMGLSLAAGNSFGAWWAAKISVRKGEKIIKYVLVVAALGMSLKLLNLY